MSEEPKLPSKYEMYLNLTDAFKQTLEGLVKNGELLAPEEVAKQRLEICFSCDKFIAQPEGSPMPYRCGVCGCGMKVKSRIAVMKCPINKWGPYKP